MGSQEAALYEFTKGVFNVLFRPEVAFFLTPTLMLGFLIRFLRWSHATSRGEKDYEELRDDVTNSVQGFQNRIDYGRSYGQLRRGGFSNSELHQARRQHGRFRF